MRTRTQSNGQPLHASSVPACFVAVRVSLSAAMLALTACASTRSRTHSELAVPAEMAAPRDSAPTPELVEGPAIVHIVNQTAQPYRVSIVFGGGSSRVLGSVSGLEARDFAIARKTMFGYEEFQLTVAVRDGTAHRESERFSFTGARVVEWTLDSRLSRSVTLR